MNFKKTLAAIVTLWMIFLPGRTFAATIALGEETYEVQTVQKTGNDRDNFVILLMGDGYRAEEQEKQKEDLLLRAHALFYYEPYAQYAKNINVYTLLTVSNESGASQWSGETDTYFGITHYGSRTFFGAGGTDKARALREAMEEQWLDTGAEVNTIHVVSNSNDYFGTSIGALFSFSSMTDEWQGGEVTVHEISHSIGRLKDEYGRASEGVNASYYGDEEQVPWRKYLGFREIGIRPNENDSTGFVPSPTCSMRYLGDGIFCEVCRLEIARYLNSGMYRERYDDFYLAEPDITINHSRLSAFGKTYQAAQVNDRNILIANGKDLEFRTIVQNLKNKELKLRLELSIVDRNGSVKKHAEQEFTVPAYRGEYDPESAKQSLSVTLNSLQGVRIDDRLDGRVIRCDTGEVVATNRTREEREKQIEFPTTISRISEDRKSLTVNPIRAENGMRVYAAFYKGKRLVRAGTAVYDGTAINFQNNADFSHIKVMLWRENMLPACDAEVIF